MNGCQYVVVYGRHYQKEYSRREKFGRQVLLLGGVDKLALIEGEKAIAKKFSRLTPLLNEGGFILMVDHRCPPEVSFARYRHYLDKKQEWIGRELLYS